MSDPQHDYPIQPVAFTQVSIQSDFWSPRIDTSVNVTIPYDFKKCEETGRIDNFLKASDAMDGAHEGRWFNDSDVFKIIEGAAYALQVNPDPELEAYIDDVINKIGDAQEDDGYLYTARTIDPDNVPDGAGPERWSNLRVNHELYNIGHMYEAGVAYYQATGKRRFLDICLKNADLLDEVFGEDKLRDVPGHQEVEIGLVKLYRTTGDEKYLKLAKFFLNERGHANNRDLYGEYAQDHLPVFDQKEAVGHAVRAAYMYSGMADVAALTQDDDYISAIKAIWDNVVNKKLALTGGIGARHEGESFGDNYELPNLTSYNETCAAQANIFWNHRLFLLTGEAQYIDILENTLYNGFLSGVGLDGESFFYVNPLASDAEYRFNRDNEITRQPWFVTSCCPTNVVRLLPALSGYMYAVRDNDLFVNLYISGEAKLELHDTQVTLEQSTNYPWDGQVTLDVTCDTPTTFTLKLRMPSWVQNRPLPGDLYHYVAESDAQPTITVDGEPFPLNITDGYVNITREWDTSTHIEINFPLEVRRVIANENVADLQDKVALKRGPIVYAIEAADNPDGVLGRVLDDTATLTTDHQSDLLGGVTTITAESDDGSKITAIPYYAWAHRGIGEMTVWMNRAP